MANKAVAELGGKAPEGPRKPKNKKELLELVREISAIARGKKGGVHPGPKR